MIVTQIITVTPKMASEWLSKCNNQNRSLNIKRAKVYRDIILSGNWVVTHQGIAFSDNGDLIDGQHRLKGIELSDTAVEVMVTKGLTFNDTKAIDNGRVRSMQDQLRIAGYSELSLIGAAILKILADKGNAQPPNLFKYEDYFLRNRNLVLFGQNLGRSTKKGVTSAPILASLAVCSLYYGEAEVERFMDMLVTGIMPDDRKAGDVTAIKFREHLLSSKNTTHGQEERKKLMKKTMRAFKNYAEGKVIKQIKQPEEFDFKIPD
ncbi:hypothetical protein PTQ27_09075 [Mannheimia sp. AT1]|uniref:DGQHR domain-containing protein n=1 Tax=Mannheimia cairinae TaxID=3025936 RepID=A0ABT5MRL0_9PAST|nr:hypothetical protein [Mannheimia cairinae]MDD0824608.1 hypothetical protein [Mannheimia cairinae]MDD0826463.1 hypothetical protein [Mannheimia cairinae]